MDLNLDLRNPIKTAAPVVVTVVREIREADRALLAQQPTAVRNGTVLKRLRDSHHKIAQLFADGLEPAEISRVTGYTLSRIYVLKGDPSMKELIAFYQTNKTKEYTDFHARMAELGMDALQELHQRLDEDPDKMDSSFLKDLVKDLADRTGFAPVSKSVNVNVTGNLADRLNAARERMQKLSVGNQGPTQVLEGEILPPGEPVA